MNVTSFAPILPHKPRVLILGSIPSIESLRQQQYYAHTRNAFWKIMGTCIGFDANISYAKRVAYLKQSKVAVWDVLKHCERQGSLDSAIKLASEKANDIAALLHRHRSIKTVLLNGKKAETTFARYILPQLDSERSTHIYFATLPSSSPANARLTVATKCEIWQKHFNLHRNGVT